MARYNPIIRMGTGKLIAKNKKMADSCCDEIYIMGNAGYGVFPIGCFSRRTLKPLYSLTPFSALGEANVYEFRVENSRLNTLVHPSEAVLNNSWPYYTPYHSYITRTLSHVKENTILTGIGTGMTGAHRLSDGTTIGIQNTIAGFSDQTAYLKAWSPAGDLLTSISAEHFVFWSTAIQSEKDQVRVFVFGRRTGPQSPTPHADNFYDMVKCYTFNGTSFALQWTWTDDSDPSGAAGRVALIHTPRIGLQGVDTCYLVSVLLSEPGVVGTARISVLTAGTRTATVDIPLNGWDGALIGESYLEGGRLTSGDGSIQSTMDTPDCAVHFDGKEHYLYLRASAGWKPTTMHKVKLSDCSVSNITTVEFTYGKPKLMGISADKYRPEEFDTLLQFNPTRAVLTRLDDPATIVEEISNTTGYPYRVEMGMTPTFSLARMNRYVNFL